MDNQKYIKSIDGLKCLAYLCIFFQHTGFKYMKFGGWGVSMLLVLSGFLLTNNYYDKDRLKQCSFKNNIKFALKKIKPLYPLHIVCLLFYIPLMFVGSVTDKISIVIYKIISNILLIQEWIPLNNSSLNECAWFLSVIFFCYFMFPYILKIFDYIKLNKKNSFVAIVLLYIVQIILSFFSTLLPKIANYDIIYWFLYRFPLVRLLDFVIGCLLCLYYQNNSLRLKRKNTILELTGLIISLLSFIIIIFSINNNLMVYDFINNYSFLYHVVIFTPGVCILIYSFSYENGCFSKILSNDYTAFISKIGRYGFLIHYVVFDLIRIILTIVSSRYESNYLLSFLPYIKTLFGSLLTVYLSKVWEKISIRFK